nr:hypothetical protein CFP56_29261 [Quercus suber]
MNRETVLHALWECDYVQACWGREFIKVRQAQLHLGSFADLVSAVRHYEEDVELFTVSAWLVWCRRNKCHFKEQSLPPEKILDAAASVLREVQDRAVTRTARPQPQPQRWSPPDYGIYKANYDGAYFEEEEAAGIGVVVRNEMGQVMASLAEKIIMPSSVEILEAIAARRAMIFMEELGLRRAIFEGDSETVVKALSGDCPDRRNICHFKEQSLPPEKILDAAASVLREVQDRAVTRTARPQPQPQRWSPPDYGIYKANYDGAYFEEEEAAGIGVVVRNEMGQVMASLAEKIIMPSSVEILEAIAARRAMIFMEELGLRRAIFEGDSETVVKALSGDCPDRSSIGHIVKDCKSLMGCFQSCSFSHVRRQSNGVAHALARRARMSSPLSVWMESVPPDISYLVYVDVTT